MAEEPQKGVKRRRVTQACDYCHQRSIRCRPAESDLEDRCTNCVSFAQPCTRNRPAKKRGVKPRSSIGSNNAEIIIKTPDESSENLSGASHHEPAPQQPVASLPLHLAPDTGPWRAPHVADQALIVDLVEVYFNVVYPIFPLFHRPSFSRKISRGEYNADPALFAVAMAVCALSSARANDNAMSSASQDVSELSQVPSKVFYQASIDALPKSDIPSPSFNVMRTYAMLSLIAIQYGDNRGMQGFLGKYHAMVAMDGLHDEKNWPQGLGIIELEERRRLFWSIYTLDVFSSIVFKSVIRVREQQSTVHYTTEVDDIFFDNAGYRVDPMSPTASSPGSSVSTESWVHGWNVTTDLWRLIEHVAIKLYSHTRRRRTFSEVATKFETSPSASALSAEVDKIYYNLPTHFRHIDEMTGDSTRDRYGFQAANITATVQLLRMVLLASEDNTIEQRCHVVSSVVHAFMRIPISYLRAINSPLLHHLGSIGAVLGGVLEERLNDHQYQSVRTVLLSLAQLLENLDFGMHSIKVAQKLRDLVKQIDNHMSTHRTRALSITSPASTHSSSSEAGMQVPQALLTEWPWKTGSVYLP